MCKDRINIYEYAHNNSSVEAGTVNVTENIYLGSWSNRLIILIILICIILSGFSMLGHATYPSSYDLRSLGKVSPVEDQGDYGTCWSFGSLGSLESTNLYNDNQVYSENNMIRTAGFDGLNYTSGGNYLYSTAYLARWSGPVVQLLDYPYLDPETYPNRPVERHVQNVIIIPDKSQWPYDQTYINNIKNAVMTYGAVSMCMYFNFTSESQLNDWTSEYYPGCAAYYYAGTNHQVWHTVEIVGWDDDYSQWNFSTNAPGNGAFIIKDSHGTNWGDGGYFYLSYYDNASGLDNAVFLSEPTTNYGKVYQYDPLGMENVTGFGSNTGWFANVFTADSNLSLGAVSFYAWTPQNATYNVYIYKNPTNGPINSNGPVAQTSGTFQNPGYYTIPLNPTVPLTPGNKFSVVVKLTTPGSNKPIPIEDPEPGNTSKATASPGQSYISANGVNWQDMTSVIPNTNVCIKAFTVSDPQNPNNILNRVFGSGNLGSYNSPGFEGGDLETNNTWWPCSTVPQAISQIDTNPREGNYSWHLYCNNYPQGSNEFYSVSSWTPNMPISRSLNLSFWAKGSGQYMCIQIESWNNTTYTFYNTPWIYSSNLDPNKWTYFQYKIPLPQGTYSVQIMPIAEGNMNVWLDDFTATVSATQQMQSNLDGGTEINMPVNLTDSTQTDSSALNNKCRGQPIPIPTPKPTK